MTEQSVWTIGDVLTWSTKHLADLGFESPRVDVEVLLAKQLGCERIELYTAFHKPLDTSERAGFRNSLQRRSKGEPVAHILGEKGFWKDDFLVNASVLIPRPESELIVEQGLEVLSGKLNPRILDIGTGSGCLALSFAREISDAHVEGWDVSEDALDVAKTNGARLGLEQVVWNRRDVFERSRVERRYDLVVSNPPYIGDSEFADLASGVKDYEPMLALRGEDEGLAFYKLYAELLQDYLEPDGWLVLEFGYRQGAAVLDLFSTACWKDTCLRKDLMGHDRVILARRA